MKKLFTLAAASVLAAGSLSAQAQVVLDGQLTAAEVTAGNYVLLGKFTNPRGFGDWGLLSLYAASTPTKVYFFVGGNVEAKTGAQGNSFQLFMNLPGVTGVPAGTALPAGSDAFSGMTAKMELESDLALALTQEGTDWQIQGAAYTSATTGSSQKLTTTAGVVAGNGTPQTLAATATVGAIFEKLAGARVAYKNTTDGKVTSNPGNVTPNTDPTYGGVGSYGWEIELDRTAMGLATGTPALQVFVLQNNDNGSYLSTDFIPQTSAPNGNLTNASTVDFTAIAGRQYSNITLSANGVLGTQSAAAAAMGLTVAPNPVAGRATISYTVAAGSEQVRIALTDLLGREVRVLENGTKAAGAQTLDLNAANLAAGTYLVKVQQGNRTATRKVVLL